MSIISIPASIEAAPTASRALLQRIKDQLGAVPNMFRLLANSPAALEGLTNLRSALATGELDTRTAERIALAVAQIDGCDYCLSAHSYVGAKVAKLDSAELIANRNGRSNDRKADVAVRFAVRLVQTRGHVGEAEIEAVRAAGYSDAAILEIIAHVALSTFTNYLNEAFDTPVDFPPVRAAQVPVSDRIPEGPR
jgi:uncharacterized peroxidase-related enzyme